MIANIPFLEQCFERFNREIFEGKLPPVPIHLTKAVGYLGQCSYRVRRLLGTVSYYDFKLRFSVSFDFEPAVLEDTVIHEMIHYYIAYYGIKDSSSHGRKFRQMMKEINQKFHRNITISKPDDAWGVKRLERKSKGLYVVSVLYLSNGDVGVKRLPQTVTGIRKYIAGMKRTTVKHFCIYYSTHSYLERLPRSIALTYHKIDTVLLSEILQNAEQVFAYRK